MKTSGARAVAITALALVCASACRRTVIHPMGASAGAGADGGAGSGGASTDGGTSDTVVAKLSIPQKPRRRLAVGGQRGCALGDDGSIRCWGSNTAAFDSLVTVDTDRATPVVVRAAGLGAVDLGASDGGVCALKAEGSVFCTGAYQTGGLSGIGGPSVALAVGGMNGSLFGCAVRVDGAVVCWPDTSPSTNPLGNSTGSWGPTQAPLLDDAVDVACGGDFACALRANGSVSCWGNGSGTAIIADGGVVGEAPRVLPALEADVVALAAGQGGACATKRDGSVLCWGRLFTGSTSIPDTTPPEPRAIDLLAGAHAIAIGDAHACALDAAGALVCFGNNDFGQLGDGTFASRATPARVSGIDGADVAEIDAGVGVTCVALRDGHVRCFGSDDHGALGDGSALVLSARAVDARGRITSVTAATEAGIATAVLDDGSVKLWGAISPMLLSGAPARATRPIDLTTTVTAPAMAAASVVDRWACFLTATGAVACSNGTFMPGMPAPLHVIAGLEMGAANLVGACVALTDGTARCDLLGGWRLPTFDTNPPPPIAKLDTAWPSGGAVLLRDGSIQSWGSSGLRRVDQLGGAATDIAVFGQACALRADGAVLCWPLDSFNYTTAAVVPLPSPSVGVTAGFEHACAWTAEGQLFCWGGNRYGQLGDGTTVQRDGPVRATVAPGAVSVASAGMKQTCAVLAADGSLWCWGWNGGGELGDGTGGPHALPTTVALP